MQQPLLITVVCLLLVKVGTQGHHSVKQIVIVKYMYSISNYGVLRFVFVSIHVTKRQKVVTTYLCICNDCTYRKGYSII